ncbi:MAG: LTA synthase family protein, partial [Planctomycetes bacterium]|nr:LTA synthase family protein [Planctomycetota bacterium]
LVPHRIFKTRTFLALSLATVFVGVFVISFLGVAEYFFWDEFSVRFNFVAVDYLAYTHEVLGNIQESYPLGPLFAGLTVLAVLVTWWARTTTWAKQYRNCQLAPRRRLATALVWLATPIIAALGIANDSGPRFANNYDHELSRNGLFALVDAFWSNEIDYESFYAKMDDADAWQRMRAILADDPNVTMGLDTSSIRRRVTEVGEARRFNVILLTIESLSSSYLGRFGNPLHLTPEIDSIARQGMLFTHCYATGTRTVRGMEALTLSIPPTPGRSIVKRPHNKGLFNIGQLLVDRGYDAAFIYGGHGFFDNMNDFFGGNGFRVVDRAAKPDDAETFGTIWGACDEDLFDWTLEEADRAHAAAQPFFHFVMTTSNHRPYTFPAGKIEGEQGRRSSAVRYTDYAIGQFLAKARTRAWFKNTLFVIVADHCASSSGRAGLPVDKYEIPLIIYAPEVLEPRCIDTLCSQIDVAPTLLALMGVNYDSEFYGRDILSMAPEEGRALIGNHQKLGLLTPTRLVTLEPKQSIHAYDVATDRSLLEVPIDEAMKLDAIAYYQSAFLRLREHRKNAP